MFVKGISNLPEEIVMPKIVKKMALDCTQIKAHGLAHIDKLV